MNYDNHFFEEIVVENEENDENINPIVKRRRLDYHEIARFTNENEFEQWIKGTNWTK